MGGAASEPVILVHPHLKHREVPPSFDLSPVLYEEANYNVGILASRAFCFFQHLVGFISDLRSAIVWLFCHVIPKSHTKLGHITHKRHKTGFVWNLPWREWSCVCG